MLKPLLSIQRGQPQGSYSLNPAKFQATFAVVPFDYRGTVSAGITKDTSTMGKVYRFPNTLNNTADSINFGENASDLFKGTPGWILVIMNPGSSTNWRTQGNYIVSKTGNFASHAGWALYHNNTGAVSLVSQNSSAQSSLNGSANTNFTQNTPHVILFTYDGNVAPTGTYFLDGIKYPLTASNGSGTKNSDVGKNLIIGNGVLDFPVTPNCPVGSFSLVAFGRKFLSDSEMKDLSSNPWQIFAPSPARVFVFSSSITNLETLLAGAASLGKFSRQVGKIEKASSSSAGKMQRSTLHQVKASVVGVGKVFKQMMRQFRASSLCVAALTKVRPMIFHTTISATSSLVGRIVKQIGKILFAR